MKIGINLINLNKSWGGAYQYGIKFTNDLINLDNRNNFIIFYDHKEVEEEDLIRPNVTMIKVGDDDNLPPFFLRNKFRYAWLSGFPINRRLVIGRYGPLTSSYLDLLVQPEHDIGALLSGVPFITSLHDMVSQYSDDLRGKMNKRFLIKHHLLVKKLVKHAAGVIVDSKDGRESVISGYGGVDEKVYILPFAAPDYIKPDPSKEERDRVQKNYNLPERFLFYAANIHGPKNHLGLLDALILLRKDYGIEPSLILVGSKADSFEMVMSKIEKYGMKEQVKYLGYVPDEDIAPIYSMAVALVIPTFIGPSNIPIIEAFTMGCPVICSNVAGYEEQIGDAGILFDPSSPNDIASAISRIWSDDILRKTLAENGRSKIEGIDNNYGKRITEILQKTFPDYKY